MTLQIKGVFLPDEDERDVWVVDGRLTFQRPAGDSELIVSGGWVIPGLVDAHCHVGISPDGFVHDLAGQAAQATVNRDTGALLLRDAGSPVDTRRVQARADLPRLIRSGRHIARTGRYIRGQAAEVDPGDLVAEVERQAAAGDGWVKIVGDWIDRSIGDLAPTFPDDVLAQAVSRAHDLGARVAVHVFGEAALPGVIAAGVDSIEHGMGLSDDHIARLQGTGTALVPTLVNTATLPGIADGAQVKFPTFATHLRRLSANARGRARLAWEAGLPVYVGTDAGSVPHGLIVEEITALVEAGLPQEDVVSAASWRAREWLGFEGLVEGAHADLVVFDADPRKSLDALHHPRRILLRGAVVA